MQLDEVDGKDEKQALSHHRVSTHVLMWVLTNFSLSVSREENLKEDHICDDVAYKGQEEPANDNAARLLPCVLEKHLD